MCIKNKKFTSGQELQNSRHPTHLPATLSFVQVPVTVAMEPSDLGVGCVVGLMLVDCFSCVLLTVEYLLWHFDR